MNGSVSNTTFDKFDFSTTSYEEDEAFGELTWQIALILACLSIVVFFVCVCIKYNQRGDREDNLTDVNRIRTDFKSIESLIVYLSRQRTSIEMIVSILYLVCTILLNTYTIGKIFDHYRQETWQNDTTLTFNERGAEIVTAIEVALIIGLITGWFLCYWYKGYVESVNVLITWVPNISVLFYFTIVNVEFVKRIKSKIYDALESNRPCGKIIKALLISDVIWTAIWYLIGVLLFVAKISQISYIYDVDILSWDFIVALGIAHQFSCLYSLGDDYHHWNFVFVMIHPNRENQMRNADPTWREEFDYDTFVCREMIKRYGVWGYLWLCHTFSDLKYVKEMYIAHDEEENHLPDEQELALSLDEEAALSSNIH